MNFLQYFSRFFISQLNGLVTDQCDKFTPMALQWPISPTTYLPWVTTQTKAMDLLLLLFCFFPYQFNLLGTELCDKFLSSDLQCPTLRTLPLAPIRIVAPLDTHPVTPPTPLITLSVIYPITHWISSLIAYPVSASEISSLTSLISFSVILSATPHETVTTSVGPPVTPRVTLLATPQATPTVNPLVTTPVTPPANPRMSPPVTPPATPPSESPVMNPARPPEAPSVAPSVTPPLTPPATAPVASPATSPATPPAIPPSDPPATTPSTPPANPRMSPLAIPPAIPPVNPPAMFPKTSYLTAPLTPTATPPVTHFVTPPVLSLASHPKTPPDTEDLSTSKKISSHRLSGCLSLGEITNTEFQNFPLTSPTSSQTTLSMSLSVSPGAPSVTPLGPPTNQLVVPPVISLATSSVACLVIVIVTFSVKLLVIISVFSLGIQIVNLLVKLVVILFVILPVSSSVTSPGILQAIPPSISLVTLLMCPSGTEVLGPSINTYLLRLSRRPSPYGVGIDTNDRTPRLIYWESLLLACSPHKPSLSNCHDSGTPPVKLPMSPPIIPLVTVSVFLLVVDTSSTDDSSLESSNTQAPMPESSLSPQQRLGTETRGGHADTLQV